MHDMWYRILRRVFDLIILVLFIIILVPDHWYAKSQQAENREGLRAQVDRPQGTLEDISLPEEAPKTTTSVVAQDSTAVPALSAKNTKPEDVGPHQEQEKLTTDASIIEEESAVPSKGNAALQPSKNKKIESKPPVTPGATWWLQVGVFKQPEGMDGYIAKLKKQKIPYRVEKMGHLLVLKVGPVSDKDVGDAEDRLRAAGITHWVKSQK